MNEPHLLRGLTGSRPIPAVMALACAVLLSACASQRDIQPSAQPLDATRLGLMATKAMAVSPSPQSWWQTLGDDSLSRLVEQALAENPSMAVALTRLQKAQAQEGLARGADQPRLQGTAEVDRQQFTANGLYPPPLAGSARTTGTLQLEGAWEFDLFGRHRAELDAAVGQTQAMVADVQAARLLLSVQVARAHVQLARLLGQREVAQRSLAQRQETLNLIRQRVQAGLDTTVTLKQGEGSLPEARLQIEALQEQIELTRHGLAVLAGLAPDALDAHAPQLSKMTTGTVPQALPMDLLARRADVMAALWRVQAAGFQADAARATFYPNVDLRYYAGYNAIGLDRLLNPSSFQWGLLPALHLPLFDGDQRRALLQGRVADQDAAVLNYKQAVLQAVQDVADQLSSAQSLARQRSEQAQAQASAEAAYDLALQRYRAGLDPYLLVLTAETAVLNQRRQALDLQARLIDNHVGLSKALGGSLDAGATLPTSTSSSTSQPAALTGDRS